MTNIQDSKDALDRAFKKLGKKRVDEIIKEVKSKNIPGPTLEQYLSDNFTFYTGMVNTTNDFDHDGYKCVEEGYPTATSAYAVFVNNGILDLNKGYIYNNPREGGTMSYSDVVRELSIIDKEYPGFVNKLNMRLITKYEI